VKTWGFLFDKLYHFWYDFFMWSVKILNDNVEEEIRALPKDMQAKLTRYINIIIEHGFEKLPHEATKHLEDKLWELRLKGKDGISRVIYINATNQIVVLLRAFVKKTQKTPIKELEIARQRAKEIE